MKERPILFSAPMVRAIIDGTKTQTRRVVKLDHFGQSGLAGFDFTFANRGRWHEVRLSDMINPPTRTFPGACPYGTIGDRLWVRETWRIGAWDDESHSIAVDYRADNFIRRQWLPCYPPEMYTRLRHQSVMDAIRANAPVDKDGIFSWSPGNSPCRWRSSRFMPRWASRITLEITDIRVERLQDISEEDARAEGVGAHGGWNADETEYGVNARGPFSHLWDSINAKRHPWASNPWVWVIEFRRAE